MGGREELGIECDWGSFSKLFWESISWKEILKRLNYQRQPYKDITAITAWTEIVSTIKGSSQAHTFEKRYLSIDSYLKQSKNDFYGSLEKKAIYEIFLHYEEWKAKKRPRYYDSMDIANHILVELQKVRDW